MLAPLTASASATTPRSSNPSAASATASSGPSPSLVTAAARASEPPRAHVDDVTLGGGGGLGTAAGESRSAVRAGFTLTARGSKSSAAAATNVLLGGGMNCVGGVEDDDDLRAAR